MEKVAVYVSFKNHDRKPIDYFLDKIANWCIMKNYDYSIYYDKVKSRLDLQNRKDLNRLKEDIENKKISKVIVKDITQLSRNTIYNIEFLEFLKDNDCQIECIDGTDLDLFKDFLENKNKEERER